MRRCSSVSGDNNSDERGIIGGQWKGRNKRTYLYKSSCETSAQREEMLRVKYDSDPNVNPGETEDCGNQIDDDCDNDIDCDDSDCSPCITVVAHKIVCNSEDDLPNWSGDAVYIGSDTAQDYVDSYPNDCLLFS